MGLRGDKLSSSGAKKAFGCEVEMFKPPLHDRRPSRPALILSRPRAPVCGWLVWSSTKDGAFRQLRGCSGARSRPAGACPLGRARCLRVSNWKQITPQPLNQPPRALHLAEQRCVTTFVSLIFATTIPFRSRPVRAGRCTLRSGTGDVLGLKSAASTSRQTIADFSKPSPAEKERNHPIVRMPNMTSAAQPKRADNHDEWVRFIYPISGTHRVPRSTSL